MEPGEKRSELGSGHVEFDLLWDTWTEGEQRRGTSVCNNCSDQQEILFNPSKFQFQEDTWKILLMESRLWCCFAIILRGHSNWEKKQVKCCLSTYLVGSFSPKLEFCFFFFAWCLLWSREEKYFHMYFSILQIFDGKFNFIHIYVFKPMKNGGWHYIVVILISLCLLKIWSLLWCAKLKYDMHKFQLKIFSVTTIPLSHLRK